MLEPGEQRVLLDVGCGITNLVARTTARADELAPRGVREGGSRLVRLSEGGGRSGWRCSGWGVPAAFDRPKAVVGRQAEPVGGDRAWVLPNPSGLNAHYQLPQLAEAFAELRRELLGRVDAQDEVLAQARGPDRAGAEGDQARVLAQRDGRVSARPCWD